MSDPIPTVTVCIVAYQSGAYLQPCLDALAAQTFADFEAVVIDNGSTDGSVEAARLPDARFRVQAMGANARLRPSGRRASPDRRRCRG